MKGQQQQQSSGNTSTLFIKNIPHGFYETEMRKYFSQFGKVNKLRISRNRKTGQSRKYAYIEFEREEVAKIVASTMNNYLMFDHILKCEVIPKEKLPPKLFPKSNKPFVSSVVIHKSLHNKNKTADKEFKLMKKHLKTVRIMEEKLSKMGIEFKCEIVNRPTAFKRDRKNGYSSNKGKDVKSKQLVSEILKGKVKISKTKSQKRNKSSLIKSKRLRLLRSEKKLRMRLLPKFTILKAATKRIR